MAQRTKISIINAALVSLGASPVSTLPPDETTAQGTAAAAIWDATVEEELRAHPWNFAVKRASLPRLTDPPAFGYSSAYNLPVDCLRILECSERDYVVESGQILCDATGSIGLRYITKVEDVTKWDALFAGALTARLQVKLAYPVTQSASQQQVQIDLYTFQQRQAKSVDAQEQPAEDFEESSLITGRF